MTKTPPPSSAGVSGDAGRVERALATARLVAASMVAAVGFLVAIGWLVGRGAWPVSGVHATDAAAAGAPAMVRILFYAVSFVEVIAVFVVKATILGRRRERGVEAAIRRLASASTIGAALSEAPAILGFVLHTVWGETTDFYLLSVVSFYLLVRHFPRRSFWERYALSAAPENP